MIAFQRLPLFSYTQRVNFSAASGLSREDIRSRIFNVMEGFEKVDVAKVGSAYIIIIIQSIDTVFP